MSHVWMLGTLCNPRDRTVPPLREGSEMKPSWDSAPKWARWVAMNESGTWVWHEKKPTPCVIYDYLIWWSEGKRETVHNKGWRNTLESRPEARRKPK